MNLPPHFHLVVVPGQPAEDQAEGLQLRPAARDAATFCVIFDAEDRPDPDQLKKVVVAFQHVAAQRRLRPGQAQLLQPGPEPAHALVHQRVLDVLRAGAARRWARPASPIPLGGTSNHFITAVLRELGAWDPFNVTEDADLGIRLHRRATARR